jgi:hypothetical protein
MVATGPGVGELRVGIKVEMRPAYQLDDKVGILLGNIFGYC